jgi:outer membrane lipoprotein-sorting protein
MRSLIVLAGALLLAAAHAQGGWKTPDVIQATVVEMDGSTTRTLEVTQAGRNLAYDTTAEVDGELGGVLRTEVIGPKGVYTWLKGKPEFALALVMPTSFEVFDFLARPRFSRADLEFNLRGIEAALGKKVIVGKTEVIAGRECLTISVPDRPDSARTDYQKLWVDRETGITMKLEDYFGGALKYSREITKVLFPDSVEGILFAPPPHAVVIRGLVGASALLRMPTLRDEAALRDDIARILDRAQSSVAQWLKAPPSVPGMGYSQTTYREAKSYSVAWAGAGSQRRENQWASGQAPRQIMIQSADGEARVVTIQIDRGEGGQVAMFRSESGDLIVRRGGEEGQGEAGGESASRATLGFVVQTDWVDPKTGHTATLFQVVDRKVESVLSRLLLGSPSPVSDQRISTAQFYEVTVPFKCSVLTWKVGNVSYALVSTVMSRQQMIDFAAKIK